MTREYAASLLLTLSVVALASPAAALTQKECSEKYQAAKSAGTLGDKSWNDFRKTECAAASVPAATTETQNKPAPAANATKEAAPAKPSAKTATTSNAVFPTAVSPKYAKEFSGQGAYAYVPRSVQRQQDSQCQWRPEVDREGWRLLQRVQQTP